MLSQMDIEALIRRLQDHTLAGAPGTMSKAEVDAAIMMLDRVLPDLQYIDLRVADASRQTREAAASSAMRKPGG